MPSIHTVYTKLKQTGLTVLLIDIQESPSTVRAAIKERGYTLPVLMDTDGSVTQAYGVHATPTVYLVNSKGNLRAQAIGPRDWDSPAGLGILRSLNQH